MAGERPPSEEELFAAETGRDGAQAGWGFAAYRHHKFEPYKGDMRESRHLLPEMRAGDQLGAECYGPVVVGDPEHVLGVGLGRARLVRAGQTQLLGSSAPYYRP